MLIVETPPCVIIPFQDAVTRQDCENMLKSSGLSKYKYMHGMDSYVHWYLVTFNGVEQLNELHRLRRAVSSEDKPMLIIDSDRNVTEYFSRDDQHKLKGVGLDNGMGNPGDYRFTDDQGYEWRVYV